MVWAHQPRKWSHQHSARMRIRVFWRLNLCRWSRKELKCRVSIRHLRRTRVAYQRVRLHPRRSCLQGSHRRPEMEAIREIKSQTSFALVKLVMLRVQASEVSPILNRSSISKSSPRKSQTLKCTKRSTQTSQPQPTLFRLVHSKSGKTRKTLLTWGTDWASTHQNRLMAPSLGVPQRLTLWASVNSEKSTLALPPTCLKETWLPKTATQRSITAHGTTKQHLTPKSHPLWKQTHFDKKSWPHHCSKLSIEQVRTKARLWSNSCLSRRTRAEPPPKCSLAAISLTTLVTKWTTAV